MVVPSLIPEPLNHAQLISLEPADPASVPQKKFPVASLFTSQPGAPTEATRSPPLRMVRPLVVYNPVALIPVRVLVPPVTVN